MLRLFTIFLFLFISTFCSFSQSLNRYNKQGQRTGKWITYSDTVKKLKWFDGKYKNGLAVGKCLYYNSDGILEKKEVSRFKRLKTTFYYPDKTKRNSGRAKVVVSAEKIHYYFYGTWKYYDEKEKLIKYCYYKKGELVKTRYLDKNNKTNDSLAFALNKIDKDFNGDNAETLDSIKISIFNPARCERLKVKLFKADSLPFKKIEKVFEVYGYPNKEVVQESSNIPFFIMSYAPLSLREKYLEFFKAAAGIGSLSGSSLAFYIDKIKVAKGEKQIYGTQSYYDKDKKMREYPSIEPDDLDKRRKSVGLD